MICLRKLWTRSVAGWSAKLLQNMENVPFLFCFNTVYCLSAYEIVTKIGSRRRFVFLSSVPHWLLLCTHFLAPLSEMLTVCKWL